MVCLRSPKEQCISHIPTMQGVLPDISILLGTNRFPERLLEADSLVLPERQSWRQSRRSTVRNNKQPAAAWVLRHMG